MGAHILRTVTVPEILIIKPSSFGDIVHGLLVAESIRAQMPGARLTWVAADAFAPLVKACRTVDEVLVFERKGGLAAFRRLLSELKSRRFDWVLDMQGLARSGVMTRSANCPKAHKLGRTDARELSGLAYGRTVPLPARFAEHPTPPPEALDMEGKADPSGGQAAGYHAHAVDILREFLPPLGLTRELPERLEFDDAKASGVVAAAAQTLTGKDGRFSPVVLFPGSRRKEKVWPAFEELAQRLVGDQDLCVIWADSKKDGAPALPANRFLDLSGNTTLLDLVPLLNAASVVVCNDSGPMHLAAALQRPVVACFGPTDPERYGPYPLNSERHRVLVAPHGDLRQLAPERVVECVMELNDS